MIDLTPKSTAALLRSLLRDAFPACRFSITTGRGAGVSSVRIEWTDGPTEARVKAIADRFESGSFDGMTDSYSYSRDRSLVINGQTYRAGCRYIFTNRHLSVALANRCIAQVAAYWGGIESVPVATQGYDGFTLPEADAYRPIRPDLEGPHYSWFSQIRQAAEDHTRFQRGA